MKRNNKISKYIKVAFCVGLLGTGGSNCDSGSHGENPAREGRPFSQDNAQPGKQMGGENLPQGGGPKQGNGPQNGNGSGGGKSPGNTSSNPGGPWCPQFLRSHRSGKCLEHPVTLRDGYAYEAVEVESMPARDKTVNYFLVGIIDFLKGKNENQVKTGLEPEEKRKLEDEFSSPIQLAIFQDPYISLKDGKVYSQMDIGTLEGSRSPHGYTFHASEFVRDHNARAALVEFADILGIQANLSQYRGPGN